PRLVAALAGDGVDDAGYARVGGVSVTSDPAAVDTMVDGIGHMKAAGLDLGEVRPLAPGEPRELFGVLDAGLAGAFVSGIGRVDGRTLRDALLAGAEAHGTRRRSGAASLATTGGRVVGVDVDGERLNADAVVAAAGAWTGELLEPLGIELPLYPLRGQLLHLDLPTAGIDSAAWPIVQTASGHYLLGFPGGRVVVGSTREEVGFDFGSTAGAVHGILTAVFEYAPDLAEATLAEVRVGFRPASRDTLPLLGPVDGRAGLVVATGLGANGLTLGPVTGAIAADVALGRGTSIDLAPYRPDRPAPSG
ncbi:MAG: NAD(P)/FAD-dependent oxidoreductase, partial [Acidimicrobiales bacterium]